MNEIKLILADDHKLFRNGLKMLLEAEKGINIIAEAENGEELLELLKTLTPMAGQTAEHIKVSIKNLALSLAILDSRSQ